MREITREIVSALIISKDNRLFQGKKDPQKGGVYVDCWHIPGGGIDDGEDMTTALIREIKEETGIEISQYNIELIDNSGRGESIKTLKDTSEKVICKMNFNVFKIVIEDKLANEINVSLDDDLVEYQWTPLNELNSIKLTPPSIELFKRLGYIK